MELLAILIALALSQWLKPAQMQSLADHCNQYAIRYLNLSQKTAWPPLLSYLLWVLLPSLLFFALNIALRQGWFNIIYLIIAVAYLTPSLRLNELTTPITEQSSKPGSAIDNAFIDQAFLQIFAPIFWFVLLGLAGPFIYQLTRLLSSQPSSHGLQPFAASIFNTLLWPPAWVCSFTFALMGHYQALSVMKSDSLQQVRSACYRAAGVLPGHLSPDSLGHIQSLLKRTLICWLVIIAVLTLILL